MDKVLYKTNKIKINGRVQECKVYKAYRLFIYYRRYRWVYEEEE